MNRLGILVDVSHISKDAMLQAAQLSRAPVIASHSSTKALCDHPRNMDDEQLLALKENGGVIQTVALGSFVKETPPEKEAAMNALREEFGVSRGSGRSPRDLTGAESDYVTRAHRDPIRALFPKARFASLPGAGHWLHAEKPREFEATVRAFLDAA